MANEKDFENEHDPIDDIELPDIDFGDSEQEDNRKPVTRVGGKFLKSAAESLADRNVQRRIVRNALPEGYSSAVDLGYEAKDTVSDLYDTASEHLGEVKKHTKSIIGKAADATESFTPEFVTEKLRSLAKKDEDKSKPPSVEEEDAQSAYLRDQLSLVFGGQEQSQEQREERQSAREQQQEASENVRHLDQLGQLDRIRQGISRQVGYQDTVLQRYHRQSLKTQIQHLFIARNQYTLFEGFAQHVNESLGAIVKNTGLPEYSKITTGEEISERLGQRVFDSVGEELSNQFRGFRERATARIGEFTGNLAERLRGISEMGEMAGDVEEMGISRSDMAVQSLGSIAGEEGLPRLAGLFRDRLANNETIRRGGEYLNIYSQDPLQRARESLGSYAERNESDPDAGISRRISGRVASYLQELIPGYSMGQSFGGDAAEAAERAVPFTQRTDRAITETIPTLLSHILREAESIRAGELVERRVWDPQRRELMRQDEVKSRLTDKALFEGMGDVDDNEMRQRTDRIIDEIDPAQRLSEEERAELRQQIITDALSGRSFDPKHYAEGERLEQVGDDQRRRNIQHVAGLGINTGSEDDLVRRSRAVRSFSELRDQLPNVPQNIESLYNLYGPELLRQTGLIRPGGQDTHDLDMQRIAATLAGTARVDEDVETPSDQMPPTQFSRETEWSDAQQETMQGPGLSALIEAVYATDPRDGIEELGRKILQISPREQIRELQHQLSQLDTRPSLDGVRQGQDQSNEWLEKIHAILDDWDNYGGPGPGGPDGPRGPRSPDPKPEPEWLSEARQQFVDNTRRAKDAAKGRLTEARDVIGSQGRRFRTAIGDRFENLQIPEDSQEKVDALRKSLTDNAVDLRDSTGDRLRRVRESAQQKASDVRRRAGEFSESAQDRAERLYGDARNWLQPSEGGDTESRIAALRSLVLGSEESFEDQGSVSYLDRARGRIRGVAEGARSMGERTLESVQNPQESYLRVVGNRVQRVYEKPPNLPEVAESLGGRLKDAGSEAVGQAREYGGRFREGLEASNVSDAMESSSNWLRRGFSGLREGFESFTNKTTELLENQSRRLTSIEEQDTQQQPITSQRPTTTQQVTEPMTDSSNEPFERRNQQEAQRRHEELIAKIEEQTQSLREAIGTGTGGGESKSLMERVTGAVQGGLGRLGDYYGKVLGGAGSLFKGLGQGGGSIASGLGQRLGRFIGVNTEKEDQVSDVYMEGYRQPVLRARDLQAGRYFDAESGEPIRSLEDIESGVVDADGNRILTEEEIARGELYTPRGRSLKDIVGNLASGYMNYATAPMRMGASMLGRGAEMLRDWHNRPRDIYVRGEKRPRLLAVVLRNGGYYSANTGSPITNVDQIDGDILDREGNVVLSMEDLATGLVDSRGHSIRNLTGTAGELIGAGYEGLKSYYSKVFEIGGRLLGGARDLLTRGGRSRADSDVDIAETLQQIRDLIEDQNRQMDTASQSEAAGGGYGAALSQRIRANAEASQEGESGGIEADIAKIRDYSLTQTQRLEAIERLLKRTNDYIQPDEVRQGSWRMQREEDEQERRRSEGSGTLSREEAMDESRFADEREGMLPDLGSWLEKLKGVIGAAIGAIGAKLTGLFGRIFGGGQGTGGVGGDTPRSRGGGTRGSTGRFSQIARGAKRVIGAGARRLPLAGALMAGTTTAASGGDSFDIAGSAGGSALGTAAGVALTSWIPIPGARVAGGILGGILGEKLGRGTASLLKADPQSKPINHFRLAQYGFQAGDGSSQEKAAKLCSKLEELLKDKVDVSGDQAKVSSNFSAEKLIEELGLEQLEPENMSRFVEWIKKRFLPVYLAHRSNSESNFDIAELSDLDDELKDRDKADHLRRVLHPGDTGLRVYEHTRTPLPGLPELLPPRQVKAVYEEVIDKLDLSDDQQQDYQKATQAATAADADSDDSSESDSGSTYQDRARPERGARGGDSSRDRSDSVETERDSDRRQKRVIKDTAVQTAANSERSAKHMERISSILQDSYKVQKQMRDTLVDIRHLMVAEHLDRREGGGGANRSGSDGSDSVDPSDKEIEKIKRAQARIVEEQRKGKRPKRSQNSGADNSLAVYHRRN